MTDKSNSTLADMPVADLAAYQDGLEARATALKSDVGEFQAELARRFGDLAAASLKKAGKTHGTLTDIVEGAAGYRVKHSTRMDVKWDSDKLMAWAGTQPWETVQHYCDITFKVKETVFKSIDPANPIKKTLGEARTEKPGKTSYEILAPSEK